MQRRHEHLIALLVVAAGLVGAAAILTVPAVFDPQRDTSAWITVALGSMFLALVGLAKRQRHKHTSARP